MTLDKAKYDEQQAERMEFDQRIEREARFGDPGPTRYVLRDLKGYSIGLKGIWYFETKIQDTVRWVREDCLAKRFDSATEAAIFATEHGITDVEVVAV